MTATATAPTIHQFAPMLATSFDYRPADMALIRNLLDGCVRVDPAPEAIDRAGTDYIAHLRSGAVVQVDVKRREPGARKYWRTWPELALEVWSERGVKTGWALCESKMVDFILFAFDPSDTSDTWLLPYQSLRIAFRRNFSAWRNRYRSAVQVSEHNGAKWESEVIFVPAPVVVAAIIDTFTKGIT